jgi:hypothetical protein
VGTLQRQPRLQGDGLLRAAGLGNSAQFQTYGADLIDLLPGAIAPHRAQVLILVQISSPHRAEKTPAWRDTNHRRRRPGGANGTRLRRSPLHGLA